MSYEGLDEEEELKTVHVANNYRNVNVVSDSNGDESEEDLKNEDDNFFDEDINDQVEINPKTTVNTKVVQDMKNFLAS